MSNTIIYTIIGFGLTYSYIQEYNKKKKLKNNDCSLELEKYLKSVKNQSYSEDILLKKYYFCAKSKLDK